jgi:hypothetical protein
LIELMVAVVAAAIVIMTVAVVLIAAFQSWRTNNAYVELRRDASLAVYLISRDIREAGFDDVVPTSVGVVLPAVTYTKSGDTLTSTDFGTIIPRGVQTFVAVPDDDHDGVSLTLGVANTGLGIAITNKVFVNTRN